MILQKPKIVIIIPAHMNSVRFPGKILHTIYGLPMIEHVRRRAKLSKNIDNVYVATCDSDIQRVVEGFGGNIIFTSNTHKNGTSRAAEAIKSIDCSHVILIQGDEPLILPEFIDQLVELINENPDINVWNATGPIENEIELNKHSFVKCAVSESNKILYCFRKSPAFSKIKIQKKYIRKILGIIAFKKQTIMHYPNLSESVIEKSEYIEQIRLIANNIDLYSFELPYSLPSVNEPNEVEEVYRYIEKNNVQKIILNTIK